MVHRCVGAARDSISSLAYVTDIPIFNFIAKALRLAMHWLNDKSAAAMTIIEKHDPINDQ